MKVIIIGAGPAGLTAAYELQKGGIQILVLESSSFVGGMSRTLDMFGQKVDCGPHRFFSSDQIVNELFHEVLQGEYTMVNRLTRIYYRNRFFNYPLKISNVLFNLSFLEIAAVFFSYGLERFKPKREALSFEDWVVRKFGKKLFSIFFKTYSEKLWGIPCDKLDADWAAQRIKKLSLFEAVKAAFLGDGKKKHKTLVDQFAYPKDGTGSLYNKMAAKIIELGGEIQFNTKVKKITEQGNLVKGVIDQSGNMYSADYIVSTMPLTEMVRGFDLAPPMVIEASEKLYFRNTTLVYLEIDSDSLFPDNWIYIHSAGVRFGRITNFRNWCPSLINGQKSTILCCEYWSFDTDEFWTWTENRIEQLVKDELAKTKLLTPAHSILNMKVIRIPKCYPVYEIGYKQHLDTIINWLSNKNNLLAIGRYGAFKYNNQDHSILMGLLAARQIRTGIKQNLWQINTDTEYQEAARVSETGL